MKLVRIRSLNEAGLARLEQLVVSVAEAPGATVDYQRDVWPILTGPDTTSHAPNEIQADSDLIFTRRFDLAEYLHGLVHRLGLSDPTRERGLWAWFALLWFDQLAPVSNGTRFVGERARWLPQSDWKYYRHLVLGAYLLYSTNLDLPVRAMALLHNSPCAPGDLVGQLAATQDVAQSRAAIGAATLLYYDPLRSAMKRGAGGSGAGSPRRFRTVLDQIDRTFDIQSLSAERLLSLLPAEFNRFK